jgi:hypothetical protein
MKDPIAEARAAQQEQEQQEHEHEGNGDASPSSSEPPSGSPAPEHSLLGAGADGDGGERPNDAATPPAGDATPVAGDEAPNAAALTAGDHCASGTQSSAPAVSQGGASRVIDPSVYERARKHIAELRKHFWTFEPVTQTRYIRMLDELEAIVK